MSLTKLEIKLLSTLKKENNPDDYNCNEDGCWFTIECFCNSNGLDCKIFRGVLSSLIKKNLVLDVDDLAPDGSKYYEYTWGEV